MTNNPNFSLIHKSIIEMLAQSRIWNAVKGYFCPAVALLPLSAVPYKAAPVTYSGKGINRVYGRRGSRFRIVDTFAVAQPEVRLRTTDRHFKE